MRFAVVLAVLMSARLAAGACLDDCRAEWGGGGEDWEECVDDCGVCGNGDVEGDEACDDGNTVAGDCCDAVCQPEPAGSPCRGDEEATADDLCSTPICDGDGECAREDVPAPDCRWPVAAGASTLVVRDADDDAKDLLAWRWRRGAATAKVELGDPTTETAFALCLYDRTGLLTSVTLPPGGTCGTHDCWRETSSGFRYRNGAGEPDGAVAGKLKQGRRPGRTKVSIDAAGGNLDLPDLSALESPLVVQLRRSGSTACWAAQFGFPRAKRNDARRFRDRSDAPPGPPTTSTTTTSTSTSLAPPPTTTTSTTTATTPPVALVEVTVLDAGGAPVIDADVTIDYAGAAVDAFDFTDETGVAVFPDEPIGLPATITVEDDAERTGSASSPGFAAGTNRLTVTVR